MDTKKIGSRTYRFSSPPSILAYACTGGKKEAEGPLRSEFDMLSDARFFGQNSWEKAESEMQRIRGRSLEPVYRLNIRQP